MKICTVCKQEKSLDDFHKRSAAKDGRQSRCKRCAVDQVVQWQKDNPEKYKANWSKHIGNAESAIKRKATRYGITVERLKEMIEQSSGVCNICKRRPYKFLVIDHCHNTTRVRGLLCEKCNQGLGLFADNPEFLRAAANYLEK
jgi:antitoxin component HigA of HigAB toxin-antitoxin module